jgi:hypothetical protein
MKQAHIKFQKQGARRCAEPAEAGEFTISDLVYKLNGRGTRKFSISHEPLFCAMKKSVKHAIEIVF